MLASSRACRAAALADDAACTCLTIGQPLRGLLVLLAVLAVLAVLALRESRRLAAYRVS